MSTIPELFGSLVFDDKVMRARLSSDVYHSLRDTINKGKKLDLSVANAVAAAMCDWAVENGATHFTHWFQPLTGITAEKHDSFITPAPDSHVIVEFSGRNLITGEPDASSFPSGGLRATFEARGYTAWDPTSYAFIKEKTLCIPTAFCSYGGEALDKKTPLLRSMEALNRQAMRILTLFGHADVKRVVTNTGPEQEYFLIDRDMYLKRRDLIYTGRTLFGAPAPKGQELDDHYFGAIKPRVKAFMEELDEELWKLGIYAKTEHNEVAPCQHELAPIFTTTNIASDHNQLTMEIMKKVARKHGLVCLLHEKPFAGVNGSGKHNNWSIATDTGENLLKPGKTPSQNAQFLLFLAAIVKGVDDYPELLRCTVASAGNDHRLGVQEAPPAILSVYLGAELEAVIESIVGGTDYIDPEKRQMRIGVDILPHIPQDTTDRNRTSPMAFTGNKFEFRMLGASQSISGPNTVLNTVMAEELRQFADFLEDSNAFQEDLHELIRRTFLEHRRIIFSGNGYDSAWVAEAERRGLPNLPSTADALGAFLLDKNVELMTRHGVFTRQEMAARHEIYMENYCHVLHIEAMTMIDMVQHMILNAASHYTSCLCETIVRKREAVPGISLRVEEALAESIAHLNDQLLSETAALKSAVELAPTQTGPETLRYYHDAILSRMNTVRAIADQLETLTASDFWPYPTYCDLLFSV